MNRCFTLLIHFVAVKEFVLKHKSSFKCAIDTRIPQSFLSDILCFKVAPVVNLKLVFTD